jgi:hypothetical protein
LHQWFKSYGHFTKGENLPIGGVVSGRVCACSLRIAQQAWLKFVTEHMMFGCKFNLMPQLGISFSEKSRIRETKHLSTDADSSTDTKVWWTKNTPKPDFFEKRKKSPKTQKLKNVAILDHFQTKMFQSETTSFHYFFPRISIL